MPSLLQEKIAMLREKESLQKENEKLNHEKSSLLKNKDLSDCQISALTKALEAHQKDLKDKEKLVSGLMICILSYCRSETHMYDESQFFISGSKFKAVLGASKKGSQ